VLASIIEVVLSLAFGISVTLSVGELGYFRWIPSALFSAREPAGDPVKKPSTARVASGRTAKLPARQSR
jgi:hypothetical protein